MLKVPITDEYIKAMLLCKCHLGGINSNKQFNRYIYGRRENDKIYVISIKETLEKIELAARAFCAIPDPSSIIVLSNKNFAKKAVRRFCAATGATPFTGRFTPGSFTNQMIKEKKEPRLIILSDTFSDAQTVYEATYVNVPCIAFTNTDNSLKFIDIAIPANNRSVLSIGCIYFIFAKMIGYMKGTDNFDDLIGNEIEYYFYRDSFEMEKMAAEERGEKIEVLPEISDIKKEIMNEVNCASENVADDW